MVESSTFSPHRHRVPRLSEACTKATWARSFPKYWTGSGHNITLDGRSRPSLCRAGSYTERLKKRSRIDRTVHLDRTWPPPPPRKQKFRPQNEENHHKYLILRGFICSHPCATHRTIGRNTGPYRYAQEIYTNIVLDREPVQVIASSYNHCMIALALPASAKSRTLQTTINERPRCELSY